MDITLANFQIKAIADLTEAMEQSNRDIILKSCTGSGKPLYSLILWTNISKVIIRRYLFGLLPAKATLRNKVKRKWIDIYTEVKQNCFQIL